jgi:hypothetical protein
MLGRAMLKRPMTLARIAAVVLFLVIAAQSTVHTWSATWNALRIEAATRRAVPAAPGLESAAVQALVDPATMDFFSQHLRPGDRYVFQLGPGKSIDSVASESLIEISSTALLPAIRVQDIRQATVLLSYQADPAGLHLDRPSLQEPGKANYITRLR